MSEKELKKLLDDKFSSKQPYSVEKFAEQMKEAAKSGLITLEEPDKKEDCACK